MTEDTSEAREEHGASEKSETKEFAEHFIKENQELFDKLARE